ncbi:hypothetical protein ABHM95_06220 [Solibacillus isronensis]|uniref:hypothetical protein n=1 Tax=Solibacillus TaxID=648800 RepID=UPI0006870FB5|nr:hypothetical protein [Solibacillus isronensis]AMO87007.1 hypothetical protein SOLI23_16030 [Solibacillus silvestris]
MKQHNKNRSRTYYRHHRKRVIQRKTKIAEQIGWHARFTGYFAKGKIHCSCRMCSQKTKLDGFPHSQSIQLERLDSQLTDFYSENNV